MIDAAAPWLGDAEWQAVRLSMQVALVAMLASLPLALLVAYALARWQFWGREVLNGLVHLPLILPPVVTGYILLQLFGRRGAVGAWLEQLGIVLSFHWTGAALAAAVMAFPLMVRALRLSIEAVDGKTLAAAASLGASKPWVFATITLPLILPGMIAAAILGFAKALGEFGATITFVGAIPGQTQTIPSSIYIYMQTPDGGPMAARLVAISIALAIGALLASEWLARRATKWTGRLETGA
jgi:molybdate transport system permease protein